MENLDLEFGKLNLEGKAPVENRLVEMEKEGTSGAHKDTERLLLPPELWSEVLDRVTNKFEASNAVLLFRDILAPKRVEFLFPQVWSILAPRINQLFPQESEELDGFPQDWRLVCKSWRSGIDSYYQEESYAEMRNLLLYTYPSGEYDVDDDPSWGLKYDQPGDHYNEVFDLSIDTNYIDEFMARFPDSNRSPSRLIFAIVSIEVFNNTTLEEFENRCAKFTHLLEVHGHQIWILLVRFGQCLNIFPSAGMRILRKWLLLVPHLKYLYFDNNWRNIGDHAVSEITQFLEENRIPTLQHLKCLVLDLIPEVIMPFFLRPNDHVQTLRVDCADIKPTVFIILGVNLNNLNQISLKLLNEEDLVCLENLAPRWNINRFSLIVDIKNQTLDQTDRVLRILETWKNTLTTLCLSMDVGEMDSDNFQVYLPELIRLNLFVVPCNTFSHLPIKVFVSSRKLQVLEVIYKHGEKTESSLFLEFQSEGQQQDPYSSPLWSFFPDLRRVYEADDIKGVNGEEYDYYCPPTAQTFFRRNVVSTESQH